MILLFLFAFVSGLITILAPCIWPLLPIVLGSATSGGVRKSLGITIGICLSFAIFTLSISYLVKLLGFDPNVLRLFAVIMIGFLGLSLVVPGISARLEILVSKFSSRLGAGVNHNGFWGGLVTGISLGAIWSPCAGPILATIATAATTATVGWQTVLITVVYIAGVGIPLFFFTWAGNWIFTKTKLVSPYLGKIQQAFGIIIILLAILIYTNYDKVIEIKLLDAFPAYTQFVNQLGNPANNQAAGLVGKPMNPLASEILPNLGHASEFTGITKWLNLPAGKQVLKLSDLQGKVVLVDFWTYTCINCIRTLPHLNDWYQKYADKGLVIIGVHTPEFEFEKKEENVAAAIAQYGIKYPVAQDNDYVTWNAYANHYWPAEYLIDAKGVIRREHFGEGEYDVMEQAIQKLLTETGTTVTMPTSNITDQTPTGRNSPETYLGSDRMVHHYPIVHLPSGTKTFSLANPLPVNSFSFGGNWTIGDEYSMAGKDAVLDYNFQADKVFLVIRPGTGNKTASVRVFVDGSLSQTVTVDSDRLYTLVDLKGNPGNHLLHLEFVTPNTEVYAFTFG